MHNSRFFTLSIMIVAAALSRIIPHPPNFTPLIAVALFGGAYFDTKKSAYSVPIAAMIMSDLALAFLYGYELLTLMRLVVYGCFAAITAMGFLLRNRKKVVSAIAASVVGSLLFFLITNFAVWIGSALYPTNVTGLVICYTAAIPFFKNTVLSSVIYTVVLFGGFEIAKLKFPRLATRQV